MSTSRGSVKSAGEYKLDENGWKVEAEAIIKDVGEFVEVIQVSDMLEVRRNTNDNSLMPIICCSLVVLHLLL